MRFQRAVVPVLFQLFGLSFLESQDFYPLKVGNFWQYKVFFQGDSLQGYYDLEISQDTVMRNGKYYVLVNPSFSGGGFERIDDSLNLYRFDLHNADGDTNTDELLLDKLGAPVGDFWLGYRDSGPRPTYTTKEDFYYTTWFGTNVSVIQIAYYTYDSTSGGPGFFTGRIHYSSKFGIIYVAVEGGASYELRGARINGTVYGIITNVKDTKVERQLDFEVLNPYPNPFNPITVIEYNLPTASVVTLKVYNVLGQEVRMLQEGWTTPGRYKISFDARDLPSGIYIYRFAAQPLEGEFETFIETRKMVLAK